MKHMVTITIPKTLSQVGELVLISKKELDSLVAKANYEVGEKDILKWSKESRSMKRSGKLSVLKTLRAL